MACLIPYFWAPATSRRRPVCCHGGYDFASAEEEAAAASWRMTGRDEKKTNLPLAPWGWGCLLYNKYGSIGMGVHQV